MRSILLAAVVAAFSSACAAAAKPDPNAVASAEPAERKICKTMPVMGSNFPKRVCSTAAEWEKFDTENYKSVEDFDRDRKSGNTQGSFEGE